MNINEFAAQWSGANSCAAPPAIAPAPGQRAGMVRGCRVDAAVADAAHALVARGAGPQVLPAPPRQALIQHAGGRPSVGMRGWWRVQVGLVVGRRGDGKRDLALFLLQAPALEARSLAPVA